MRLLALVGAGRVQSRRLLATSVVSRQTIKTPTQVFGVEGRYATALYSAALKEKKLDAVEKELSAVKELYDKDVHFHDFVLDPTFKRADKKSAILSILHKLKLSSTLQNFFGEVAENGRLSKLSDIVKSFEQLMTAHRGELFCEVTTAKPLETAMARDLSAALEQFAKTGERLTVSYKVDPTLVGGMIVKVGDKYIDMSLSTKILQYTDSISAAI